MTRRGMIVAIVLALSLAAIPSGAAHRTYTIAYVTYTNYGRGGREAAKRLGVRIVVGNCDPCKSQDVARLYTSLIERHVDAIVNDGYNPDLIPIFRTVRKAGILVISAGDDIAGARDLFVGPADPVAYGEALADALASQIGDNGEYAILDEQGEYPIARAERQIVANYIPKAHPKMKLDAAITETGAGDPAEVDAIKGFMASHPHLKGLISITPTETYMAGEAITQAGRIGQVFSSGNGGNSLGDPQLRNYVKSGAEELVFEDNPTNLGYLVAWAADYLLTGHHFTRGEYQVGAPIGAVWYYPKRRELRLGQLLTITKANLAFYANTF